MPIKEATGSIFDSPAQVLVNPVNCVGVMGKGLAKQFAMRYPGIIEPYKRDCESGTIRPGHVKIYEVANDRHVVCFPTKKHWKDLSHLKDIVDGLFDIHQVIVRRSIESIAIPALGCGLGGLKWDSVQSKISGILGGLKCLTWVYPPL